MALLERTNQHFLFGLRSQLSYGLEPRPLPCLRSWTPKIGKPLCS